MKRIGGWIVRVAAIGLVSIAAFWYLDRSFSDNPTSILATLIIWFYFPAMFVGFFLSGGVHGGTPWGLVVSTWGGILVQNLIVWLFAEWLYRQCVDRKPPTSPG